MEAVGLSTATSPKLRLEATSGYHIKLCIFSNAPQVNVTLSSVQYTNGLFNELDFHHYLIILQQDQFTNKLTLVGYIHQDIAIFGLYVTVPT